MIYNQYTMSFLCFESNLVLAYIYAVTYGIGRDLHAFAGVVELCFIFCMNFPSATIRAAEFPLVYPEVNNL